MPYLFMSLMGVFAGVYAVIRRSTGLFGRMLFKSAASVMFVLTALSAFTAVPGIYGVLIILGLCASLTGDVLLIFTHRANGYLLAGMLSFFAAHLLYISAFWTITAPTWIDAVFFVALLTVGALIMRIRRIRLGRNMPAVFAYAGVLCLMATRAISMLWVKDLGVAFAVCTAAGGVLFVVSDTLLGGEQFADAKKLVGGLSTAAYYSAQALTAISVVLQVP